MKDGRIVMQVNTAKTVLCDEALLYKTESFIKKTRYIANIDLLISKIAETLFLNYKMLASLIFERNDESQCLFIQTSDSQFSFFVKLGSMLCGNFNKKDIIFFDILLDYKSLRQNDQRVNSFIFSNKMFGIYVSKSKKTCLNEDFNKLYHLLNTSVVNLPRLDENQKNIVETVDKNVLVQGVAGSGKTNICIDKIIFSACKNYSGKVLYSTYSRGLLIDTKIKIENYKKELENFIIQSKNNDIIYVGNNKEKALENKFGITFFSDDNNEIYKKITNIIEFLDKNVDFLLIEDIYHAKFNDSSTFFTERDFVEIYAKNVKNYQISKAFLKLKNYSNEIIYKEIYGMILGNYSLKNPTEILPLSTYISKRKDSFSIEECNAIYAIAIDFKNYLYKNHKLDNNIASIKLLQTIDTITKPYSLIILDEVQDFTEVNLNLFKSLSYKMFCVGDALQMINPSYFSFAYLKNLLYVKDITSVCELKNNYRNTKKIAEIINNLSELNRKIFGTHNFLLNGVAVESGVNTKAIYLNEVDFISKIAKSKFDNFTFVVPNLKCKNQLKKLNLNQEILTVSEIKGLERPTIIAVDLLSDNVDKWNHLYNKNLNHKIADENSVYRFYYNLFYVGISRAKQNLFVVESKDIPQFKAFFAENFEEKNASDSIKVLNEIVSKIEFTETEIFERVNDFIRLGQYENATFAANKIKDDILRIEMINRIKINEKFVSAGKYHEAGIEFLNNNMFDDAKQQFILSNEPKLVDFVDAYTSNSKNKKINIDIIEYFDDFKENDVAKNLILNAIKNDINALKDSFEDIKEKLKRKN